MWSFRLAYQSRKSPTDAKVVVSPNPLVFATTTTLTKFSVPNTSSSTQRTRCRFSSLIWTKMLPASASSSRAIVSRSRR